MIIVIISIIRSYQVIFEVDVDGTIETDRQIGRYI